MVLLSLFDEAGRITGPDLACRDVLCHDRTGPDDGVLAYGHRLTDDRTAADVGVTLQVDPATGICPGSGLHEVGDNRTPDSHPHTVLYDDVLRVIGIERDIFADKHFLGILNFYPPILTIKERHPRDFIGRWDRCRKTSFRKRDSFISYPLTLRIYLTFRKQIITQRIEHKGIAPAHIRYP